MAAQQQANVENIMIPPPGMLEDLPTTTNDPNQAGNTGALAGDPNQANAPNALSTDPNTGAYPNAGASSVEERKKTNILRRYFSQSVETPEERAKKDAAPPEDPNPFTLRRFMHENIVQSIPAKTPPPQPAKEPLAERVIKKDAPKDNRTFWQKIKDSFKRGEKDTTRARKQEKATLESDAVDTAAVQSTEPEVQGPDPEPAK